MRGKVNYGISGNYVINGVRKKCTVDGASVSKGDFVNVHNEPEELNAIPSTVVGSTRVSGKKLFELSDGNYLLERDDYVTVYDPRTATNVKTIGTIRGLSRIGNGLDEFVSMSCEKEASGSSYVKFVIYVSFHKYDPEKKTMTTKKDAHGVDNGTVYATSSTASLSYSSGVYLNENNLLAVSGITLRTGSYTNYGIMAASYVLSGDSYETYAVTGKKWNLYVSSSDYIVQVESYYTVSKDQLIITNNNYYSCSSLKGATAGSTSVVRRLSYSLDNLESTWFEGKVYTIPIYISESGVAHLIVDSDGNVSIKEITPTGSKNTSVGKISAYVSEICKCVSVSMITPGKAFITFKDELGYYKRLYVGSDGIGNTEIVQVDDGGIYAQLELFGVGYKGDYDDNFILWEWSRDNTSQAFQNVLRSKKILNHNIINTKGDTNVCTSAAHAKYTNGVANGSGSDGDEIECIVTAYES